MNKCYLVKKRKEYISNMLEMFMNNVKISYKSNMFFFNIEDVYG